MSTRNGTRSIGPKNASNLLRSLKYIRSKYRPIGRIKSIKTTTMTAAATIDDRST